MTTQHWSKNYTELPEGVYCAQVRSHSWPGIYVFQAQPNRGDWCWEFLSTDLKETIQVAEAFARGERDSRIYTASL